MPQVTKPGTHGTLRLYRITVADDCDADTSPAKCWGYSAEDAMERFNDMNDGFGWTAKAAAPVVRR